MKAESTQAVQNFLSSAETEFTAFAKSLKPEALEAAVTLVRNTQAFGGHIHITGIGKSCHVVTI